MAARPQLPERFLLYFVSGGAQLTPESQALLPGIVASAAQRPAVDVSIIGHTDTVGRAEQNEELALKRAQAIAELIKAKGLKVHALAIESHGERNLLIKTADETAEPRNRRVEISLR
jgi:outer membrane protein OmpA-like peptidoglycan-associated protein